jgi:hypothetical protein
MSWPAPGSLPFLALSQSTSRTWEPSVLASSSRDGSVIGGTLACFSRRLLVSSAQETDSSPISQRCHRADPALPAKTLREQFQKLVLQPLGQVGAKNSLVMVLVDAMDNCDEDKISESSLTVPTKGSRSDTPATKGYSKKLFAFKG